MKIHQSYKLKEISYKHHLKDGESDIGFLRLYSVFYSRVVRFFIRTRPLKAETWKRVRRWRFSSKVTSTALTVLTLFSLGSMTFFKTTPTKFSRAEYEHLFNSSDVVLVCNQASQIGKTQYLLYVSRVLKGIFLEPSVRAESKHILDEAPYHVFINYGENSYIALDSCSFGTHF